MVDSLEWFYQAMYPLTKRWWMKRMAFWVACRNGAHLQMLSLSFLRQTFYWIFYSLYQVLLQPSMSKMSKFLYFKKPSKDSLKNKMERKKQKFPHAIKPTTRPTVVSYICTLDEYQEQGRMAKQSIKIIGAKWIHTSLMSCIDQWAYMGISGVKQASHGIKDQRKKNWKTRLPYDA